MRFTDVVETAGQSLKINAVRSLLAALGIVIGIAAVVAMLAVGNGTRLFIENSFRSLGSNVIRIEPRLQTIDGETRLSGKPLTYEDGLQMPAAIKTVSHTNMAVTGLARVQYQRGGLDLKIEGVMATALAEMSKMQSLYPKGGTPGQDFASQDWLQRGRFFTQREVIGEAHVCVLGTTTAQKIFGATDPVGQQLWINYEPYQVIGLLSELEYIDAALRSRSDPNQRLLLPVSSMMHTLFRDSYKDVSVSLSAYVVDESQIELARQQVTDYLRQRHNIPNNKDDDFVTTSRRDVLGVQQDAANAFSALLTATAVVALSVGGIGIMNIMLVSVLERTREIGIRRAVGARRADIIAQFLVEAVLISVGGGAVGVVLGVASIPLIARFVTHGLGQILPGSIPLGFGVCALVGLAFGLYPALRAARLTPIEVLRAE